MRGIRYLIYKLKGRKRVNANLSSVGFVLNSILLGIGLVSLTLVIFFAVSDFNKEQKAEKTEGTIASINYENKKYHAVVKYVVDEKSYEGEIIVSKSDSVSDKKIIKYNRDNPSEVIENDHVVFIFIGGAIAAVSIIRSLIFFVPYLINLIVVKGIRKKGYYVDAVVDEIFINNKAKKFLGFYPYRIRLKYVNPTDGNVLIFDSQDSYADLKQIVEDYGIRTLPVFIDIKDPNKYYVDLEIILPKKRR